MSNVDGIHATGQGNIPRPVVLLSGFLLPFADELFHEPVSFPRHFPGFGRVHQVFEQQQFVVKMLDGRIQGAAVFSPVGKGSGNPDGPDANPLRPGPDQSEFTIPPYWTQLCRRAGIALPQGEGIMPADIYRSPLLRSVAVSIP